MEVMLRCAVPDRPGALAGLLAAIAAIGGDIHAVDVVETVDGTALDDLVVVIDPAKGRALVDAVRALPDVRLVHAGPSRGHPGDAVTRLAIGLEALLSGAMDADHALQALVGGLLRASSATFCPARDAPDDGDDVLVLDVGERCLVVRRDYRFTDGERQRAHVLARTCLSAARAPTPDEVTRIR